MILSLDVGTKNLGVCIINEKNDITFWKVLQFIQQHKEDLCCCIVRTLDTFDFKHVDTVLIEKQPSRNNKMRIVEALLQAYFVIRGKLDKDSKISKVLIYSAKHKLGVNTAKGKTNYRERKKLSVERTKEYLTKSNQAAEHIEMFNKEKKKDDLADSLLQALSYTECAVHLQLQKDVQPPAKTVVARKPTERQSIKGMTKSNIKWILKNNAVQTDVFNASVLKFFNSIEQAKQELL